MDRTDRLVERVERLKAADAVSEAQLRGLRQAYEVAKPADRRAAEREASIRYVPHPAVVRLRRERAYAAAHKAALNALGTAARTFQDAEWNAAEARRAAAAKAS